MDVLHKIQMLGESAQYDICVACGSQEGRRLDDLGRWIYPAVLPDGQRISLLKVLQTNACHNDCYYCAQRASRDARRTAFSPDELAATFDAMNRRGLVKGLFLSSALAGNAVGSMDRCLATVELLRKRYEFRGYIHLKLLPGASMAQVEQAVRMATRVSVNVEAPSPARLQRIAPDKAYPELLKPMTWAHDLIAASGGSLAPGGQTTQFVVGAAGESDREILGATSQLYRQVDLRRAYFSAFQPVRGTPLEGLPATRSLREHRLYQSDFLMRQYGFGYHELVFDGEGNLPFEADPKRIWAQHHPERFPVEVEPCLLGGTDQSPRYRSYVCQEDRQCQTTRDAPRPPGPGPHGDCRPAGGTIHLARRQEAGLSVVVLGRLAHLHPAAGRRQLRQIAAGWPTLSRFPGSPLALPVARKRCCRRPESNEGPFLWMCLLRSAAVSARFRR